MHAPHKSRAVAARLPKPVSTLLRLAIAVLATATLVWLSAPTVVHAQEGSGTYQVQAGDNLWSLAVKYYGDGQKWIDLAKLNDIGVGEEKGLLVGQTLRVPKITVLPVKPSGMTPPANTPRAALVRARQPLKDETQPSPSSPTGALAVQTAGKGDAMPKPVASSGKASGSGRKSLSDDASQQSTRPGVTLSTSPASLAASAEARRMANSGSVASASNAVWNIDAATARSARGNDAPTIFLRTRYDAVQTDSAVRSVIRVEKPRNRTGEFSSAPYALDAASVTGSGRVGRRTGGGGSFRDIERLVLTDEAEITLPPGASAAVGSQWISVQVGAIAMGGPSVATPTGVLEVMKADAGRPVIARVVRQSGRIEEGQPLMAFVGDAVSNTATATPVARGAGEPETHIVWIEGDALLPTLQSFVLLAATERDGVKPGDEFALVKRSGTGADAPEQQIAVVRVVRVSALGSTAIVIRQSDAAIAVGGAARLIARAN